MATFTGTSNADTYTGSAGDDRISGGGGADSLAGGAGGDDLGGDAGPDTIDGGEGNDRIFSNTLPAFLSYPFSLQSPNELDSGSEVDVLRGSFGNDYIFAGYGDIIDGGSGDEDTLSISFLGSPGGVQVDFRNASQTIGTGTITGIEFIDVVQGSRFDDYINAKLAGPGFYSPFSKIFGAAGNDSLVGGYHTAELHGDEGDDELDATRSSYLRLVTGGDGNDVIKMEVDASATAYGGAGDDRIYAYGSTFGGSGNDYIEIGGRSARAHGDDGDDVMLVSTGYGGAMAGGDGSDSLTGGEGDDFLGSGRFASVYGIPPPFAADTGPEKDILSGGAGNDTFAIGYGDDVDGGSGSDTLALLSLGGATAGLTIDLSGIVGAGTYTRAGGRISNVEKIEKVIGSGFADTITVGAQNAMITVDGAAGDDLIIASTSSVEMLGGAGNDVLEGGSATDILDGGAGMDRMSGKGGNDLYYVDNVLDQVVEAEDGGLDQVNAAVSWTLAAGQHVELVRAAFDATGNEFGNILQGSGGGNYLSGLAGADTLTGYGGNDTLDGGSGDDRLNGGDGNDVYYVDSQADIIEEDPSGSDSVYSTISLTLADALENLTLLAGAVSGTGNGFANRITGNVLGNVLSGGGNNDTLDGAGGADSLTGGDGNDFYVLDDVADQVIEGADGGNDTVTTNVSWLLPMGVEVETLKATGANALDLTGNDGGNIILGNDAANQLRGLGGEDSLDGAGGDDQLFGGQGNDVLNGGFGNDTAEGGAGDDTLWNVMSNPVLHFDGHDLFSGGEGADTLYGGYGNDHLFGQSPNGGLDGGDYLSGADGSDYLQGNAGNDTLDGGIGSDRINGGADNDEILGWYGNDSINGNRGNDSIDGGYGNDSLRGGQGDDILDGGEGADRLLGDMGSDTLIGGNGEDVFLFGGNSALIAGGAQDVVDDFEDGTDRIGVGYQVTAVLTASGSAASDLGAATATAQLLFASHAGVSEVALVKVGTDTYLFYSQANDGMADSAVRLVGVDPANLSVSDFALA